MDPFFLSEFSFAEKICDRDLLRKFPKHIPNRAQVIIGEIIAAEYNHDVDWSKVSRLQKLAIRKSFTALLKDLKSNVDLKRDKFEGLSKVRAFLTSEKYSMLFPNVAELNVDEDDNDKRYF